MKKLSYADLGNLPEYKLLLQKRRAIVIPLNIIVLASYFSFILMVAYAPGFLAQSVAGTVLTYGILFGLGMILITFLTTAIYVWYANTHIEHIVSEIERKASSNG